MAMNRRPKAISPTSSMAVVSISGMCMSHRIMRVPNALDGYGCAPIDPVEEVVSRVAMVQRDSNAAVRCWSVGNRGVSMDKHVPLDLDAPRHRCEVVEPGKMHSLFSGARGEVSIWSSVPFSPSADVSCQNQLAPLICHEGLTAFVNDNRFRALVNAHVSFAKVDGGDSDGRVPRNRGPDVSEFGHRHQSRPIEQMTDSGQ
jgi:hypothetical protein